MLQLLSDLESEVGDHLGCDRDDPAGESGSNLRNSAGPRRRSLFVPIRPRSR